ncbi:MAG: ATP-binding cassette domain-containing protein [Tannerellaceae bacterium]|jgi:ABC-2 type transport system ATP-binding protein|nr:ATP-binding cassette domain-containing protein [Tannerellaceae bacterium]
MLNINNLYKSYGKNVALSGISFSVQEGMICGIAGKNGSGKTTLFECVRNLQPYEGHIAIGAADRIGYLPEALYFYPAMKGREYIEFCLSARKDEIDRTKINRYNQLFELPLNDYAVNYSTGMKKKLALMALLLQENTIYILDEPFNGLDLSSCLILRQILFKLKLRNRIVLLSSHILSSLTDICDIILYLNNHIIEKTYPRKEFAALERDMTDSITTQVDNVFI